MSLFHNPNNPNQGTETTDEFGVAKKIGDTSAAPSRTDQDNASIFPSPTPQVPVPAHFVDGPAKELQDSHGHTINPQLGAVEHAPKLQPTAAEITAQTEKVDREKVEQAKREADAKDAQTKAVYKDTGAKFDRFGNKIK